MYSEKEIEIKSEVDKILSYRKRVLDKLEFSLKELQEKCPHNHTEFDRYNDIEYCMVCRKAFF